MKLPNEINSNFDQNQKNIINIAETTTTTRIRS